MDLFCLRRRVLSHVDDVLHAVVDIALACLQRLGVPFADRTFVEPSLPLVNDKAAESVLLAPEHLALKELVRIGGHRRTHLR